jgi:hypothetical protein
MNTKVPAFIGAISTVLATGLLLVMPSISGIALAAVNCNTSGSTTICTGGSGEGPQGISGGGGGGGRTTAQCTERGCPETVTGGFGGGGIGGPGSSTGVGGGAGLGGQRSCLVGVHSSCTTTNGGGSFPK